MSYSSKKQVDKDDEIENHPILRSLSMSHNVAQSMLDEVPHMIHLTNPIMSAEIKNDTSHPNTTLLRRSSSTSSLLRLRSLTSSFSMENYFTKLENTQPISIPFTSESNQYERHKLIYGYGGSINSDASVLLNSSTSTSDNVFESGKNYRRNDLLIGVVVSRWDNIVGPQCIYLWTEERTSTFYPGNLPLHLSKVIKYVTDHTVDHQDVDGNSVHPSTQRSTLCIVPDLSLTYMSISIRVPSEQDLMDTPGSGTYSSQDRPALSVPHAVSVLANLQFLNQFLLLRPLIFNWLGEFSPKIGVLLCKNKLQSSMINSWCAELCKTVTSVKACWGQEVIRRSNRRIVNTAEMPDVDMTLDVEEGFNEDRDYLPPCPDYLPKTSWATLLSSHLTTCGSSVVVGADHTAVNQVIKFLLCFCSSQERYCSKYVLPTLPDTYMKGLFVQGLILGEIGEKSISFNQVTSNRYPSTHVELGAKHKIRQRSLQLHRQNRINLLMEELTSLWTSTSFSSAPIDPFPHQVKEVAGFVNQFIEELLLLPPGKRSHRLLLFRRMIHAKAIALIVYLKSIERKVKKEKMKLLKSIPEALGLDEQEYLIVQTAANKIRPGILQITQSKE